MRLPSSEYVVARQQNDGDCLPASLAVILSLSTKHDMLVSSPLLKGDGLAMRAQLTRFVAEKCQRNDRLPDGLLWRDLVETDFAMDWTAGLTEMEKGAVYDGKGCMIRSGTFVGDTFLRAFEIMHGTRPIIVVEQPKEYVGLLQADPFQSTQVALLRSYHHYDVIIHKSIKGWVVPTRRSSRKA